MSRRILAGLLILIVLGLAQAVALTVPTALLLAKLGASGLEPMARAMLFGTAPIALAAAVAAAAVPGTLVALALWRLRYWGLTAGLLLAPVLMPIALLAPGAGPANLAIQLAGHASLGLGLGACCGLLGLLSVDRGVLRAAQCCRVSKLGAVRRVLLPLMAPGISAGLLLAAVASLATSLVQQIQGTPATLMALASLPGPVWLAAAGVTVLMCALSGAALVLLRSA
jgi:putative spermidine/putrescine transport system permease protein